MLSAPLVPLAAHASFGQNWVEASSGSSCVFIYNKMPLDAHCFKPSRPSSPVSGALPAGLHRGQYCVD